MVLAGTPFPDGAARGAAEAAECVGRLYCLTGQKFPVAFVMPGVPVVSGERFTLIVLTCEPSRHAPPPGVGVRAVRAARRASRV